MARLGITAALALALAVPGCSGGGDEGNGGNTAPPASLAVTISWAPNRESTVNRPGGGYEVAITGQPVIDVPYVSGPTAPTSVTVVLVPGVYEATVRAYAAFDPEGGTRSFSAPQQLSVVLR